MIRPWKRERRQALPFRKGKVRCSGCRAATRQLPVKGKLLARIAVFYPHATGMTSISCRIRMTEPEAPARVSGQGEISRSTSSVSILLLEARMADVVRLTEWRARMPKRETVPPEAPARILLFTGVRYERLTPAMLVPRGKAGKRGVSDNARRK